ncbi:hypothetical protein UNH65_26365 [Chitinophaga sp. 180180018-2]|nr:hypothetical protein [Chitinophaga sp. 212800010-3]
MGFNGCFMPETPEKFLVTENLNPVDPENQQVSLEIFVSCMHFHVVGKHRYK